MKPADVKPYCDTFHWSRAKAHSNIADRIVPVPNVVRMVLVFNVLQCPLNSANPKPYIESKPIVRFKRTVIQKHAHPICLCRSRECNPSNFLIQRVIPCKGPYTNLNRCLLR